MLSPKSWSLSVKISLAITGVVASVGFVIGAAMVTQDWNKFHEALGENALLQAESVAVMAPTAILRKDYWSIYLSLKNLAERTNSDDSKNQVMSAMVLDAKGRVQAHLDPSKHPIGLNYSPANDNERELFDRAMSAQIPVVLSGKGFQEGVIPLFADKKYLGVVRVRLSIGQLYEKAWSAAITVLGMIFGLVILSSLLGSYMSRRMVGPLSAITRGLESIGRGDMVNIEPVPVKGSDEIGRLSATFNKIMAELREKKVLEKEVAMSEKLVALGRISAGVAHEVNNPLSGLINCIDTLQKHPNDQKLVARYLPLIEQGLFRIRDIVSSLLVELKAEESEDLLSAAHIDIARDLLEAEIGTRDIKLVWDNQVNDSVFIQGRRVEQIVCNLLINAVQAIKDGGTIKFSAYQEGSYITLEVSDDGPGIPISHRSQLFDPFFTTKSNGAGLGLWIVYRLVQSMGGIIEVESEEGQGTMFHISIPMVEMKAA